MNKKYLTFLSAILIATISACGGSQSSDAPRHQEEPKSDPAPQPDPEPAPEPRTKLLTVQEVNLSLQKFNGLDFAKAYSEIRKDALLFESINGLKDFELHMENRTYSLKNKN